MVLAVVESGAAEAEVVRAGARVELAALQVVAVVRAARAEAPVGDRTEHRPAVAA